MMEPFQHLRLSERHFRITETKEIWQQLDCNSNVLKTVGCI